MSTPICKIKLQKHFPPNKTCFLINALNKALFYSPALNLMICSSTSAVKNDPERIQIRNKWVNVGYFNIIAVQGLLIAANYH
jgi:hypothetical protein